MTSCRLKDFMFYSDLADWDKLVDKDKRESLQSDYIIPSRKKKIITKKIKAQYNISKEKRIRSHNKR